MAREWSDEEVQAEIREAVRIAREDGILKHVRGLTEKLDKLLAGPDGHNPDDSTEGKPPPTTEPKTSSAKDGEGKKRSLWWGERLNSE